MGGEFLNTEPKKETPGSKKVLELMEISGEELEELKARIAAQNGKVSLFVHPLHHIYHVPEGEALLADQHDYKRLAEVRDGFGFVTANTDHNFAVFVMEEETNLEATKKFLADENSSAGARPVYVIATKAGTAEPDNGYKGSKDNWDTLRRKFSDLAVKEAQVGGMFFWPKENDAEQDPLNLGSGCVGDAIQELRPVCHTRISHFTNPGSRKDVILMPGKGTKFKQDI